MILEQILNLKMILLPEHPAHYFHSTKEDTWQLCMRKEFE